MGNDSNWIGNPNEPPNNKRGGSPNNPGNLLEGVYCQSDVVSDEVWEHKYAAFRAWPGGFLAFFINFLAIAERNIWHEKLRNIGINEYYKLILSVHVGKVPESDWVLETLNNIGVIVKQVGVFEFFIVIYIFIVITLQILKSMKDQRNILKIYLLKNIELCF